jgi:hypothetical protein
MRVEEPRGFEAKCLGGFALGNERWRGRGYNSKTHGIPPDFWWLSRFTPDRAES